MLFRLCHCVLTDAPSGREEEHYVVSSQQGPDRPASFAPRVLQRSGFDRCQEPQPLQVIHGDYASSCREGGAYAHGRACGSCGEDFQITTITYTLAVLILLPDPCCAVRVEDRGSQAHGLLCGCVCRCIQ